MKKWEYKIECFEYAPLADNINTIKDLKKFGEDSWELVNMFQEAVHWYTFVFKREIKN